MRTVTYGGAVSLDGFLAGVDGSIDWLHFSKEVQQIMTDFWKDVDTILMGRKTYEVSVAMKPSSAKKPAKAKSTKRKEPATRTYVFSRTLRSIDDAGVVDEIGLNIHPILLGSGIPTFRDPGHRIRLTLTECRQIEGGCILANYKVLRAV